MAPLRPTEPIDLALLLDMEHPFASEISYIHRISWEMHDNSGVESVEYEIARSINEIRGKNTYRIGPARES